MEIVCPPVIYSWQSPISKGCLTSTYLDHQNFWLGSSRNSFRLVFRTSHLGRMWGDCYRSLAFTNLVSLIFKNPSDCLFCCFQKRGTSILVYWVEAQILFYFGISSTFQDCWANNAQVCLYQKLNNQQNLSFWLFPTLSSANCSTCSC